MDTRRSQSPLPNDILVHNQDSMNQEYHPSDKIRAYYSLIFPTFTFYIQKLTLTIGRRCTPPPTAATTSSSEPVQVDVDLGALKSVSRLHAKIDYDKDEDRFVLVVIGRNGAWVDGVWSGSGSRAPLGERSQIQIASRTFHFVLPPPPPPEDTPSPSSQSSTNRQRSPSLDITSISPPSSQPSYSPPPPIEPKVVPPQPEPQLPNSTTIGRAKGTSKKRKKSETEAPPPLVRPKPEDMPPKPTLTYAHLIYRAVKALNGKATLQEICNWIQDAFDYYKYCDGAWMSSVRHNLSSNRAFKKMERCGGDRGKGFFWSIDEKHQQAFEEQEARSQQAANASTGVEGGKGKKKEKGASILEPPLKRSVKGDLKGAPLPPPLTSTPLIPKSLSTPVSSIPASSTSTPVTTHSTSTPSTTAAVSPIPTLPPQSSPPPNGVFAYPTHHVTLNPPLSTAHAHASSTVKSGYSASPLSAPNPYAPSHNPYAPNPYAPNPNTSMAIWPQAQVLPPHPGQVSSPASTSYLAPTTAPAHTSALKTTTATSPQPLASSSTSSTPAPRPTKPDLDTVHIKITISTPPPDHPSHPSHPAYDPSQPPQHMFLHKEHVYLSPDVFGDLTETHLRELESLGAQKALDILKGHMVRFFKAGRGPGRGRVRGRGRVKKAGVGRGAGGGPNADNNASSTPGSIHSGPFTNAPLPNRTLNDARPAPAESQDVDMTAARPAVTVPVPVPVSTQSGNDTSPRNEGHEGSPIIIVDDSDPEEIEEPASKRRRLDIAGHVGAAQLPMAANASVGVV